MSPSILVTLLACGSAEPTPAATPASLEERGAQVFATHCAACHGPEGRGDGPGAAGIEPPLADLNGPRAAHLRGIPKRQIIEEGRPGTAMIGWKGVLSDAELDAVYAFVHSLRHGEGGPHGRGKHGKRGHP